MASFTTENCQNCKTDFTIEPEDFDFYKKIDVPPPTWCPRCRNIRRLAWREYRNLYKDECALCGKDTVSLQDPEGPFTVYCHDCWFSDKWDAGEYARDYDFNKPFFQQFRELLEAAPRPALTGRNMVDSEYCHACVSCKNCYFCFWTLYSQDSQYAYGLLLSRDTYDSYVADNSDHAYETVHVNRLFRASFAYFSDDCLDSAFLWNCVGCSDCFGCVNLRKKKYCLWNEQLSKKEYKEKIKEWDLGSYKTTEKAKAKFRQLYLSQPHKYAHITNAVDVTGDIIRDTKNCHDCFTVLDNVENCKYIYGGGLNLKDSFDVTAAGDQAELLYENTASTRAERVMFSSGCSNAHDVQYSEWSNFSDLFGCYGLDKKKYCILNKEYSAEEYRTMVPKIKKHMDDMSYVDQKGRVYKYGEFFPPEISPYAYNDSVAMTWYPKTKEEALAEGYRWREPDKAREHQVSVKPADLPDHIRDASDDLLQETIGCLHQGQCDHRCSAAFRISAQELSFYRDMSLALPRLCPNCRHAERFAWRNRYDLYSRRCMCQGRGAVSGSLGYENTANHFHGSEPCPNKFETAYAPGRPEMIYCGECYKVEFL